MTFVSESIFEMLASFLKNNENKQNKTANSKRKPPAPDLPFLSGKTCFLTLLCGKAKNMFAYFQLGFAKLKLKIEEFQT